MARRVLFEDTQGPAHWVQWLPGQWQRFARTIPFEPYQKLQWGFDLDDPPILKYRWEIPEFLQS